jgi:hypothetical protein
VNVVVDDRLLIEQLLFGIDRRGAVLHTTTYWYYRACRAAIAGAGGHLSGPFRDLSEREQGRAISAMLQLPAEIGLPESRRVVPHMVDISLRHPMLNIVNLEVVAMARSIGASVWLSPPSAAGVLPDALDAEDIVWDSIEPR